MFYVTVMDLEEQMVCLMKMHLNFRLETIAKDITIDISYRYYRLETIAIDIIVA